MHFLPVSESGTGEEAPARSCITIKPCLTGMVDRLGNPIDRGRPAVTPQDDADRPDVQRRVPDTPLEQLADRGVAVVNRQGHIINAPVRR